MTTRIKERVKQPRVRISTVVNEMLTPLLLEHSGKIWTKEFVRSVQKSMYEMCGRHVGFREVNVTAVNYAVTDLSLQATFSFNVVPTKELIEEYNGSSVLRRQRFDKLYNPTNITFDKEKLKNRFQISIPNIRSIKQYDVQLVISEDGRVWPVGVIGYYGSNMNSWADRVGLKHTFNPHKHPSTHYMDKEAAQEYVFIIHENAGKFL